MADSLRDALAARPHPFVPLRFTRRTIDESLARARAFHDEMQRAAPPGTSRPSRCRARSSNGPSAPPAAPRAARTSSRGRSWRSPIRRRSGASARRRRRRSTPSTAAARPRSGSTRWRPLGTDEHKPHLTDAPWVVVLFRQAHGVDRRRRQAPLLLHAGIVRHRRRVLHRRGAHDGAGHADPHPEPDGLPGRAARAAGQREGDAGDAGRAIRRRTRRCRTSRASRSTTSRSGGRRESAAAPARAARHDRFSRR